MKKILSIITIIAFSVAIFSGCSCESNEKPLTLENQESQTETFSESIDSTEIIASVSPNEEIICTEYVSNPAESTVQKTENSVTVEDNTEKNTEGKADVKDEESMNNSTEPFVETHEAEIDFSDLE